MPNLSPDADASLSKPVLEFLTVANEYCLFFESAAPYEADDIFAYFRKIAPLLYLKAATLPEILPTDESFNERFVTEEQWEAIFKSLREKFGTNDTYFILDQNNDTHEASLSDNMADIYQDMKDFVLLYQKGPLYARENAIHQISHLMVVHWGIILLDALKASHIKVFNNMINTGTIDDNDWLI